MKSGARGVTVVIQRDGTTRSQTLRFSRWSLRLAALAATALLAGLGLLAMLYLPVVRAAARVPGLERQVSRLRAENAMVRRHRSRSPRHQLDASARAGPPGPVGRRGSSARPGPDGST